MSDPFSAIRPFNDDEVAPVIHKLLRSDSFLFAIARLRFGDRARAFHWLLRPALRLYLGRQLRHVNSVSDLQLMVRPYLSRMISETTDGFSVTGLEQLDRRSAYLFVSNHRDIVLDPALSNYALHAAEHQTLRIAIGDNLLKEEWVADLMRLNKSFIVQRSVQAPREFLAATKLLSRYIWHSIHRDNVPVWIAQREGRAKDGADRTEPAMIKMLSLSREKKSQSFSEHIAALRIVPVSISYELDPCDAMKAKELWLRDSTGAYEKDELEDVTSIGRGIAGQKGRVHIHFGSVLAGDLDTPQAVAEAIDRQVLGAYRLHPSNLFAFRRLHGDRELPDLHVAPGSCSEAAFQARIDALPEAQRDYALAGYANPVLSKLSLSESAHSPVP